MLAPMKPLQWISGKRLRDASLKARIYANAVNSGTKFVLSRDELLTLPEFVLLSLFPNGLFPEGQMGGLSEGEAVQVDVSARIAPSILS
jgi:hypothetical protein